MAETKKKKTSSTALPIGYVLRSEKASYRIEKFLNQGGYGITYKVSTHIKHGNITLPAYFAVKEFFQKGTCWRAEDGVTMAYNETMAEDVEESLHDFISEGTRIARICKGNKNIVDVNEVFKANGTAYYVMEYINGGSLKDLVRKEGTIGEEQALSYILPIAGALSYIHEEKLLHLDIKPENIMIRKGEDGQADEPVLIDFGVTIHFNDDGTLTSKHAMYTTKGYSPQEQYGGITGFSPEADIYALSATLFYLLTGHDPIPAFEMRPDYIKQNLPKSISGRTFGAIMNGMKVRADERTHSIEDFINSFSDGSLNPIQKPIVISPITDEDEEQIPFWENCIRAFKKRSILASIILLLSFCVSALLLLFINLKFLTFYDFSITDVFITVCFSAPFFLMVAMLGGKKWGFWGAVLLYFITLIGYTLSVDNIPGGLVVGLTIYIVLLWSSLFQKSYWEVMDNSIADKSSLIIIGSFVVLSLGMVGYNVYSEKSLQEENATSMQSAYTHSIEEFETQMNSFKQAKTIEEKVDDMFIAKRELNDIIDQESWFHDIQPSFYNKSEGLKASMVPATEVAKDYLKGVDFNHIKDYQSTISALYLLKDSDDSLQAIYESVIAESAYLRITDISFCNYGDSIIDDYGSQLFANRMRWLGVWITYYELAHTSDSFDVELQIKIIGPKNELHQNNNSPEGYTLSETLNVGGNNHDDWFSYFLHGWGNASESGFERGTWKYEIWHKGKKIYSTKILMK